MNDPDVTEEQVRVEELVSWTCRERIRFLWYRFRMSAREMNYATSVMLMPTFLGDVGGSWVILRDTDVSSGTVVDDGS